MCPPVDGHHREAAAAAAGERVRRELLPGQRRQHAGVAPEEVRDQPHKLDQGYGMIPAENTVSVHLQPAGLTRTDRTHSAATKLQSDDARGTKSASREATAKTCGARSARGYCGAPGRAGPLGGRGPWLCVRACVRGCSGTLPGTFRVSTGTTVVCAAKRRGAAESPPPPGRPPVR